MCIEDNKPKGHKPTKSLPTYHRSLTDPQDVVSKKSKPGRLVSRHSDLSESSLRNSSLVPENNAIDVSWFARQGLMSKQSFKVYKKELKTQRRATMERDAHEESKRNPMATVTERRASHSSTNSEHSNNMDGSSTPAISKKIDKSNRFGDSNRSATTSTTSGPSANFLENNFTHDASSKALTDVGQTPDIANKRVSDVSALGMTGCSFIASLDEDFGDTDSDSPTESRKNISRFDSSNSREGDSSVPPPPAFGSISISETKEVSRRVSALGMGGCSLRKIQDEDLDDSSSDEEPNMCRSVEITCPGLPERDISALTSCTSNQSDYQIDSSEKSDQHQSFFTARTRSDKEHTFYDCQKNDKTPKTSFKSSLTTIQSETECDLYASDGVSSSCSVSEREFTTNPQNQNKNGDPKPISSLVCQNSKIEPSWFASRGLMSRTSYKKYIKELKAQDANFEQRPKQKRRATHAPKINRKRTPVPKKSESLPNYLPVSLGDGIQSIAELFLTSVAMSSESEKNEAFSNLLLNKREIKVLNKIAKRLSLHTENDDTDDDFFNDDEIESPEVLAPDIKSIPQSNSANSICSDEAGNIDAPLQSLSLEDQNRISDLSCLHDKDLMQSCNASTNSTPEPIDSIALPSLQENAECKPNYDNEAESIIEISPEQRQELMNIQVEDISTEDTSRGMLENNQQVDPESNSIAIHEHTKTESSVQSLQLNPIPSGDESDENDEMECSRVGITQEELLESIQPDYLVDGTTVIDEGLSHLSMAMLALLYRKLREMSLLGHVSVKLRDIDVNSHQAISRQKELSRRGLMTEAEKCKGLLDRTRTASFVIRAVLDECQMFKESADLLPLNPMDRVTANYDASILEEINSWVETQNGDPFGKDSLMKSLVDNEVEVVWFSDRHPNDLIYGIFVNRQTKTVTVAFRGQESAFARVKDSAMTSYPNPIAGEDYAGNTPTIRLRSAVSEELLRVRRDTSQTAVEFIRDKVAAIGKELVGDGGAYHLSITGHGLAGGYATLLGFYLASDLTLELASAVRVFSFASSRIGCTDFQRAFRYLEDLGLILHARFTNQNDMLSLRPFFDVKGSWWFKDWYKHVGMHIQLYSGSNISGSRPFVIEHITESTLSDELLEMVKSYIYGRSTYSHISDYHHRMIAATKAFNRPGYKAENSESTITLDDIYTMRDKFQPPELSYTVFYIAVLVSLCVVINMAVLFKIMHES